MNKVQRQTIHTLLAFLVIVFGLSLSTNAQSKIIYTSASDLGKSACSGMYPKNKKFEKAKNSLVKGGCWSCPKGYERSKHPSPDKPKSCRKKNDTTKATFAFNATWGGTVCKGKENWLKNKKCWVCPSGFKRSLKETSSGHPLCKPRKKYSYNTGTYRGEPGAVCPKGYLINPLAMSLKSDKACMKFSMSKKKKKSFLNQHKDQLVSVLNSSNDLIRDTDRFQQKIQKVIDRKGIKNLSRSDFRNAGGVQLLQKGCGKQFGSMTITVGGDGSKFVGANGAGGFAFGLVDECETGQDGNDNIDRGTDFRMMWVASTNLSIGASVGFDGGVNIGFWRGRYDDLHGWSHGIVGEVSTTAHGANASGWWNIDWTPGRKGEFSGISLGYQVGKGGGIEYNWGYTFQKGSFGNCKDVTVEARNKTGREVKVIDVDYFDFYKDKWRSEPTKNTKVANNKKYSDKFNLNWVDHGITKIRVKYRKRERDGGWSKQVYRDWSSRSLCSKGKKYTLKLEN